MTVRIFREVEVEALSLFLSLSLQLSEEKENSRATSVLLKSANFGLAQEEKTM